MTVEKPPTDAETPPKDDAETPSADAETDDDADDDIESIEEINPFRWLLGKPR